MSDKNSPTERDWRLQGQEKFIQGKILYWRQYKKYRETWDHDHCLFCGAKFKVKEFPDVLHEGYSTADQYYWICKECFDDFQEQFHWELANSNADEVES